MADEIRRLIRVRTAKGARFKRDGFGKKPQLADSWRKPRGQHNKQREQKKAKGALPKPGFGSPNAVRGMHPSGFFEVLVYKIEDLEGLNPKTQSIRIAATVGGRKRAAIQDKALTAGIRVLNAKAIASEKKTAEKAVEEKEKPAMQEPKKEKKEVPAKKVKPAATQKKEVPAEKKSPAKKKTAEAKQESAEAPKPKEEQKKKAQKPAAEAGAEVKPKKSSKSDGSVKEAKPAKKAAAKPKKKTIKEGEEQ